MTSSKKNMLLLVLTAFIWGVAFVAQSEGGDAVGPYTFNGIRNFIGALVLIPVIKFFDSKKDAATLEQIKYQKKDLLIGGICCGLALFTASTLQQLGLYYGCAAGKAGFLTACYIVIVPIIGIFLGKKCSPIIWLGVALTLIGLYLLCINGDFYLEPCDLLVLSCAFVFSAHILVIDHFSPRVDGVRLSSIQFAVCGILSLAPMLISDMKLMSGGFLPWLQSLASPQAWIAILYAGVLSSGVAYTLQIIGQKGVNPAIASLIMSLESVFSVLAGWAILHEVLTKKELLGCLLIFIAVILAQLPSNTDR